MLLRSGAKVAYTVSNTVSNSDKAAQGTNRTRLTSRKSLELTVNKDSDTGGDSAMPRRKAADDSVGERPTSGGVGNDAGECKGGDHCGAKPPPRPVQGLSLEANVEQNYIPSQSNTSIQQGASSRQELKPHSKWVILGMKVTASLAVMMYFIIPAIIRLNPWIMLELTFLHRVHWPPFLDLTQPEDSKLNFTQNFYISSSDDVTLGAWHVLPLHLQTSGVQKKDFTELMTKEDPVVLYLHGNAGTRAGWHRVQLYKVLARLGFHVIAIDYRGYADSTGFPSEDGVVADGISAYRWIRRHSSAPVYLWGHSLGSGVATKVAKEICDQGLPLDGLILEAPFNNLVDAAAMHPFSKPFVCMPWFTWAFVESMTYNKIFLASDKHISRVTARTLILHAKDDGIIPYSLGIKLYQSAIATKERGGIHHVSFEAHHGYGHKHIHKASDLPDIIRKFKTGEKLE